MRKCTWSGAPRSPAAHLWISGYSSGSTTLPTRTYSGQPAGTEPHRATAPSGPAAFSEHPDGNCIEVAPSGAYLAIRESDEPGITVGTTAAGLGMLLASVKAGAFGSGMQSLPH
nr:DUF397 domain-containing protein [Streptomyces caatingaensis]